MSDSPIINAFLSLSSLFVLIAILVGPIPNLFTNYEKHQELCDKRKMMFATLMYWALFFLAVYTFSSGTVFVTVKSLATVPGKALSDGYQAAKEAVAAGSAAASTAVGSAMQTVTSVAK
jgi:hypothetical protein